MYKEYNVILTTLTTIKVPSNLKDDEDIFKYIRNYVNDNWDDLGWKSIEYEEVEDDAE